MDILDIKKINIPSSSGIYMFWCKKTIIYIGKSISLKRRIKSYFNNNLYCKTKAMITSADKLSFIEVNSEIESLLLEASLIKKHKPKYNILLKDDKQALYIKITKDTFPRVILSRTKGTYGPFPNSRNVKYVLKLIRKIFPYSDHLISKRACLYSHLGLCNPCPNQIQMAKDKIQRINLTKIYNKNIRNIKLVLSRKFNVVRNNLEKEMQMLSKQENYEKAVLLRDKIKMLDYITQSKIDSYKFVKNPNLIEDIRNNELQHLKQIVGLSKLTRIEGYDVAHFSGSCPTASMVVCLDGKMENSYYRHFKIRQKKTTSDYDNLKEIVSRRIKHLDDWGKPNLIIVDGGFGQVKIFNRELLKVGIKVVGIAKNPDRLVFADGRKVRLKGQAGMLIARIRDEAHRFARRYHHKLIKNNLLL